MFRKNSKIYRYLLISSIFILVSCGGGGYGSSSAVSPSFQPYTWQTATPASVGLTSDVVNAAMDYAMTDGFYTQSAIIVKDGNIIGEQYRGISQTEKTNILTAFNGFTEAQLDLAGLTEAQLDLAYGNKSSNDLVHSWSMGKSITSILFGIAQDQGIISINSPASNYITEWNNIQDQRQYITIRNLLDMRSGLIQGCFNSSQADQIDNCIGVDPVTGIDDTTGGGNISLADDQLTGCINQEFNGIYDQVTNNPPNVYSNCDTMILGEILHRALTQGYSAQYQNIFEFAKVNLFDKLGITAYWWKDNATAGQDNGNYVTYAGLDMKAKDFIKIGQLLLNDGLWVGEQILSASYIQQIKTSLSTYYYSFKFYKYPTINSFNPTNTGFIGMAGFDGQHVLIDFENKILIARNSLYSPVLNAYGNERKMTLPLGNLPLTSFPLTLPTILTLRSNPVFGSFAIWNATTSSMAGALYLPQ